MTFIVRQIATTADGREIVRSASHDEKSISIGRSAECAIHLPDLAVAPNHAQINVGTGNGFTVESISGQNFEWDGRSVSSAEIDAARGAELRFGGHLIGVDVSDEEGADGAIRFTVKRVDAVSDSTEEKEEHTLFTLQGLLPGKRMSAWSFIALVLLAFLAWPIYAYMSNKGVEERSDTFHADTMWISGDLSKGHQSLKKDCQACHVDAFVAVRDNACLTCHEDDAHNHADPKKLAVAKGDPQGFAKAGRFFANVFNRPAGRCVECHTEHEGAGAMQPTAQRFCAECHDGMDKRLTDTDLENATDFGIAHPQFRPEIITKPDLEKPETKRVSLDDKPTEYNGLKFPHDLHLSKTGGVAQMGRRLAPKYGFEESMQCSDCHTSDPNGVRFEPVNMKKNCSMCHSLAFEEIAGTFRTLRHGEPELVRADLRAYYRSTGPNRPINLGGMARRRPGESAAARTAGDYARAVRFRPSRADLAIKQVFSRGGACFDCHSISPPARRGSVDYRIQPVSQTNRYMHKGWFSHAAHDKEDCASCHAADKSSKATDLLLPGIKTCQECHGGESSSADVPSTCAMCHDYHADDGAPWMIREQDKQKRAKKKVAARN